MKHDIYSIIHRLFEARDEDEFSINASVARLLEDLKEDYPELYSEVVESRFCKQNDI